MTLATSKPNPNGHPTKPNSEPQVHRKKVRLNLKLHPGQREVVGSTARFRVVACGRQWGKTRVGTAISFKAALEGKACWWVSKDFPLATIGWKLLKKLARQIDGATIRESERLITFESGGWVQVKSAHDEGSLRAETLDLLVIDEAAFINEERWYSELRPTIAVKRGKVVFISTFNGENWFYDLYQRGLDPYEWEWESWRKVSTENPYFSEEELEKARRTTPREQFEQEYLANPLIYVGAVFDGELLQKAIDAAETLGYEEELPVYGGVDWGFTNETALELCQEHVEGMIHWFHEERWQAVELNKRCREIAQACVRYDVRVLFVDAAGATERRTLADHLDHAGAATGIKPVPFGKYKEAAIAVRRWYLENEMEALGNPGLAYDSKRYRYKEDKEEVEKKDDHTVDAATAFYASRRRVLSTPEENEAA